MYLIIWKYVVEPKNMIEFEFEYREHGTWSSFFRTSEKYLGSYLIFFGDGTGIYLLIDTWSDRKYYERFIKENKNDYNKLSLRFSELYLVEKELETINL